nr:hypothetical protein [Lactobacillus delbrueckii]
MKILSISTATSDLSVALNEADHLVSEKIEVTIGEKMCFNRD